MPRPPPRWQHRGLACLVGLGLLAGPSAADSGTDERLQQRAQGERTALVTTLESLVRIETPTEHLPGLAALADLLARRLGVGASPILTTRAS